MVISKENLEEFLKIYKHINKIENTVINNPRFSKEEAYNYLYNITFSSGGFDDNLQSIYEFNVEFPKRKRTIQETWEIWKKEVDNLIKVLTTITTE